MKNAKHYCSYKLINSFSYENVCLLFWCSGYMPPEYAMEGMFSIKSDIYSFGVLMLEIVCGRKNNNFYDADHALKLVGYVCNVCV